MENAVSTEAWASRLEAAASSLNSLLSQPGAAERLRVKEGAEDWTAVELLGHVVEMIPYWVGQCRTIVAAAEPPAFGRGLDAPDRLAGPARGISAETATLLATLQSETAAAAAYIRTLTPEAIARQGLHPRRGLMSVGDALEILLVAHLEDHLRQAQAILA